MPRKLEKHKWLKAFLICRTELRLPVARPPPDRTCAGVAGEGARRQPQPATEAVAPLSAQGGRRRIPWEASSERAGCLTLGFTMVFCMFELVDKTYPKTLSIISEH